MPLPFSVDFKNPDYQKIIHWRLSRLLEIRKNPEYLPALKLYYKDHPAQFIVDWGSTIDPRNMLYGRPTTVPFILFPKQEEWVAWLMERCERKEPGLTEKSRQIGASWLAVATSAALCLFREGVTIGFGSRKREYVDKIGDPKSLFDKLRQFMRLLPDEFLGGWVEQKHSKLGEIIFPGTNSVITGEWGDQMGRGGASSIFFADEFAFIENPRAADAALSQNSPVRIYMSTPNGFNNLFAEKRHSGDISVFTYHWRDDPRKDEKWYAKTMRDLANPVIVAQELDLDYFASAEGVLIPSAWVQASIDAHIKLGITPHGTKKLGFDVADEGKDLDAAAIRHGVTLTHNEEWHGKGSDIYASVVRVFGLSDDHNAEEVIYDADGLGSGVRGDARVINEKRHDERLREILFQPFFGSGSVANPDEIIAFGRTAEQFFKNRKAQGWWALFKRFQNTYRMIVENIPCDLDETISLSSKLPALQKLVVELNQITYRKNDVGKIIIDKAPDGMKSPNLADAVMMCYAPDKKRRPGFFDV